MDYLGLYIYHLGQKGGCANVRGGQNERNGNVKHWNRIVKQWNGIVKHTLWKHEAQR